MSTKKKPAAKPSVLQPLVKLTFAKFPNRPVSVYFEKQKLVFYADFGFEQYESPSVAGLKQKIEAAIKKGATPDVTWVPVIEIAEDSSMAKASVDRFWGSCELDVERKYIAITRKGLQEVAWGIPEKARAVQARDWYQIRGTQKVLPKLPYICQDSFEFMCLVPYDEQLFQKLRAIAGQIDASTQSIRQAIKSARFDKIFIPKAAAAPKPAKKPAPPVSNKVDNHQPELPLGGSAKKGLGKSLDAIRDDVKKGSGSTSKKKSAARNGDHTAREHLIVKYQGKELTLGHGPLGNYLVNALKPHYPQIHSAFCLKDNQIQISITGGDTFTMSGEEFELKINHAPPPLPKHGAPIMHAGPIMPEVANSIRKGAIERLHELAKEFEAHDSLTLPGNNFRVIDIPNVILLAAGFPKNAAAEMQQTVIGGQNRAEIILRLPKKSARFMTVQELEQQILEQVRAAEPKPQEELANA